jgi:hypothetical protein
VTLLDKRQMELFQLISEPQESQLSQGWRNFLKRLWLRDRRSDPEFRRALGVVHGQIGEIRRLLEKTMRSGYEPSQAIKEQLIQLLQYDPNSITAAWELVYALDSLLPRLGDWECIETLLALELRLDDRTGDSLKLWGHYGWGRVRWSDYFQPEELRQMHETFRPRLLKAHVEESIFGQRTTRIAPEWRISIVQ